MNFKTITPETYQKLHRLHGGGSFWNRVVTGTDERVEILVGLGLCGEPVVIAEIAQYLLVSQGAVQRATRAAIQQLMVQIPPVRLAELDYRVREVGSHQPYEQDVWRQLKPGDLPHLAEGEHAISVLGLASFHASGHVREAAIRLLAERKDGIAVSYLLLRLNDWVEPVRRLARQTLQKWLTPAYAPHFLANLPLVLRLELCGRAEHTDFVQSVAKLLRSPECRDLLLQNAATGDRATRRACLRLATEGEEAGRLSILRSALDDSDSLIRFWSARRLLPDVGLEELPRLSAALVRDSFMPVRREALQALAGRLPAQATTPLRHALLDGHASIRETARYYLKEQSGFDASTFYRVSLRDAKGPKLAAAIRGLGETGGREDRQLMGPFLAAKEARLRKAAIGALARLAPEQSAEIFLKFLSADEPTVSQEACTALLPRARFIAASTLAVILGREARPVVRKNALKLVLRLGKWERLPLLLTSSGDSDEKLAQMAKAGVNAWWSRYNRSYAQPTPEQLAEAKAALTANATKLSVGLASEIGVILDGWNKK